MLRKPITKVEIAGTFWKDLEGWRRHPEYWTIRRDVARIVRHRAAGKDGGDNPFTGGKERWGGLHHAHITSKLIVFTGYPEEGVLKLCAITKHDAYGFRQERKSMAGNFAAKMQRALAASPVASPEWSGLRWRDPGDIAGHPELPELSDEGLKALYLELHAEQESFARLDRRKAEMSPDLARAFEDAWLDALIEAQEAVQAEVIGRLIPRSPRFELKAFKTWSPSP